MYKVDEKAAPSNGAAKNIANHSDIKDKNNSGFEPIFDREKFLKKNPSVNEFSEHLAKLKEENSKLFPYEVYPQQIRDIIEKTTKHLGFNLDWFSAAILALAGVCIGRAYKVYFKDGFVETCIIYMAPVGGKGTGKSAPLKWLIKPLFEIDDDEYKKYIKELEQWKEEEASYKRGDTTELKKKPTLSQTVIQDCTPEAMFVVHSQNKRALLLYQDELAAWFKNFGRYNKGSDAENWLSMWNGGRMAQNRISKDPLILAQTFVSVIGGVQPPVLDEFGADNRSENGFTDRVLFVWPDHIELPSWDNDDIDDIPYRNWRLIVRRLLNLPFATNEFGESTSNILTFSTEARNLLIQWQAENRKEDMEEKDEIVNGVSAKIQTYVIRFALIMQLLRYACEETGKEEIDTTSVEAAIKLAAYFKRMGVKTAKYIKGKNPIDRLPQYKKELYQLLDNEFELKNGIEVALTGKYLKERAFKDWVKDTALFKCVKHGVYQKTITD